MYRHFTVANLRLTQVHLVINKHALCEKSEMELLEQRSYSPTSANKMRRKMKGQQRGTFNKDKGSLDEPRCSLTSILMTHFAVYTRAERARALPPVCMGFTSAIRWVIERFLSTKRDVETRI